MGGQTFESLKQEIELLKREMDVMRNEMRHQMQGQLTPPVQPRLARTVATSGGYPTEESTPSVYPIVFLDGSYTETPGLQTPTLTAHSASDQRVGYSLSTGYIPENSLVAVWRQNNRYWIVPAVGSTPTNVSIISIHKAAEATICDPMDPDETSCLYDARLEFFDSTGGEIACDRFDPIPEAMIWAVALNRCKCIPVRPRHQERYLARQMLDAYGPSDDKRPLYAFVWTEPPQTAIVEVTGGEEADCTGIDEPNDCLWPGKTKKLDPATPDACDNDFVEDDEDCWIYQVNNCDKATQLKKTERYVGHCVGEFNGRPTFAIEPKAASEGVARWGSCLANWIRTSGGESCDYVVVDELEDCEGPSIAFDTSDPNYGTFSGVTGYKVLCPKSNDKDTNLVFGDTIAFIRAKDGTFVICSDYLDDKIGTIKLATYSSLNGWQEMDGTSNGTPGSGIDMTGRTARHKDSNAIGYQDGRNHICLEELEHHHLLSHTQIIHDGEGAQIEVLPNPLCTRNGGDTHPNYARDQDGHVTDTNGKRCWEVGFVAEDAPLQDPCTGDWGPLPIANPYTNLYFIERIDNSHGA